MGQLCSAQKAPKHTEKPRSQRHSQNAHSNQQNHYSKSDNFLYQSEVAEQQLDAPHKPIAEPPLAENLTQVNLLGQESKPDLALLPNKEEISNHKKSLDIGCTDDAKERVVIESNHKEMNFFEEFPEEEKEEHKINDTPAHYSEVRANDQLNHSDPPAQNDFEEDFCIVCLETFEDLKQKPVFTTCGHCFCRKCIVGALAIRPYCPLCRTYQQKSQLKGDLGEEEKVDDEAQEEPQIQPEPVLENDWNLEVVRARLREEREADGSRRVVLSNGEMTNIFVGKKAQIQVAPTANIVINGKRVENPQDCNVQ